MWQVARRAGWVPDSVQLVHVPFGFVQGEDGKKFKTRSGETVRLKDLLEEAIVRARADLETRLKKITVKRRKSSSRMLPRLLE